MSHVLPEHPFARDVKGTHDTLSNISKADLLETYHIFLNSKKVLISTGDFDISYFQGQVDPFAQKLSEYGNELPSCAHVPIRIGEYTSVHPLGFSGIGMFFNRNAYADKKAQVISQFLNDVLFGKNGLCLEKIRYERGLAYGVDNVSQLNQVIDIWGIFVECGKENISQVKNILQHLLFEDIYAHVTQERIVEFITKHTIKEKRNFRTTDDFLRTYAGEFLYRGLDILWHDDALLLLKQITLVEIKEHIKKIYTPENQSTVLFV